jgi:hypothetical protein
MLSMPLYLAYSWNESRYQMCNLKPRWAAFLAALLTTILILTEGWYHAREPEYGGKTLTSWLEQQKYYAELQPQAAEAVRHIGAAAIPLLLREVMAKESRIDHSLKRLHERFQFLPSAILAYTPAYVKNNRGARGFAALGQPSETVMESLRKAAMKDGCSPGVFNALAAINPQLIVNFGLLTHANPTNRAMALNALGTWGGERATNAVPAMIARLADPNEEVRLYAVGSLGFLKQRLDLTIPALIGALKDPNRLVRSLSVERLRELAQKEERAINGLKKALESSNPEVRKLAGDALGQLGIF